MKKNVFKNYLYNAGYQLIVMLLSLITIPYVARVIGPEGLGAFSYTQSITYYFILFGCMGLNLYGQREVAYVQDDIEKRSKVFFELMAIRTITYFISIITFIILCVNNSQYKVLFLIQIIDILASYFDISWFFQGIEDFKKILIRNFIVRVFVVVFIFTLIKGPEDLYLYVFCYVFVSLVGNLSMWIKISKVICSVSIKKIEILKHIKPTLILFIPQVATSIYTVMDKTMIGALTQMETEVSFYEQAQKIVKVALTLITSVGIVMLPRISSIYAQNQKNKVKEYLNKSFRCTFLLSFPLAFGLASVSSGLVPWFLGEGYEKSTLNMIIIAPILIITGITNVIGIQYLLPTNRQQEYLISIITGATMNGIINFILIPYLLSLGASIASVIAELSIMICQIYFVRKEFDFKKIIKESWKYLIASIIMFCVILILCNVLVVSILSTFVEVFVGSIVYIGVLLLMHDKIVMEYKKKIMLKIKNI